jgi:hypothetical protein
LAVSGELNIEEPSGVYSSPSIIRMIKSRRIWAGHVARMREDDCIEDFGGRTRRKETTKNA